MKKLLVVAVVLAIALLGASVVMAAGITNTKHDLSSASTGSNKNTVTSEICVFCHTPHGALTTVPLWNRTDTTSTFTLYSSATFNATTTKTQPSGASKACLGCHDGTLAISANIRNQPNSGDADAVAGTGVTAGKISGANTNLGIDLSNDHPVSFSYAESLAGDTGLLTEANVTNGAKIIGGRVECASCHDVHSNTNAPFLRGTMTGSKLCLGCHIK
jgi:predicted CXXCH cytochrome family protein